LRTTNDAPPEVTPETIATLLSGCRYSAVAGPGPMYVASIDPEVIAAPASEPELKYVTCTSTPGSACSNMPSSSAT
jgi:hypothetical protein